MLADAKKYSSWYVLPYERRTLVTKNDLRTFIMFVLRHI